MLTTDDSLFPSCKKYSEKLNYIPYIYLHKLYAREKVENNLNENLT